VKFPNRAQLGCDDVAQTGSSYKVTLKRLLWQVVLTCCSDKHILLF